MQVHKRRGGTTNHSKEAVAGTSAMRESQERPRPPATRLLFVLSGRVRLGRGRARIDAGGAACRSLAMASDTLLFMAATGTRGSSFQSKWGALSVGGDRTELVPFGS
jgi:hypothetical protein